jgi:hypothetical protein
MAASGNTTVKAVEIPVDSPVRLVRQWDRRASVRTPLFNVLHCSRVILGATTFVSCFAG